MPSPPPPRGARIPAEMAGHLITNVRILDGTGREPFAGAVRVEGNRIGEVAAGPMAARPEERVIDGRGAMLMPRLVRTPAHPGFPPHPSYHMTPRPPQERP